MSTLRNIVRARSSDVGDLREEVYGAFTQFVDHPFLDGILLAGETDANGRPVAGITFAAGVARVIPHGLGRAYRGWWVARDFGAAASSLLEQPQYISGSTTVLDAAANARGVSLVSATACTVNLWVY